MCTCKSDGALGGDPSLGGLHLVITEVVPIGGGVDKKRVLVLVII